MVSLQPESLILGVQGSKVDVDLPNSIVESALWQVARGNILLCNPRCSTSGIQIRRLRGRNGVQKCRQSEMARQILARYPKRGYEKVNALVGLSSTQWRRISEAWEALGLSVIVNRQITTDMFENYQLVKVLSDFKIFWINSVLRSSSIEEGKVILPNLERSIASLKHLSAWAGWYCAGDPSNPKPKILFEYPGLINDQYGARNTLVWFGGPLEHLCDPWSNGQHFLKKEMAWALAQVRVFGRALPSGFGKMLETSGKECLEVLTSHHQVPDDVLELFSKASKKLSIQFGRMGTATHISCSKSATFDSSPLDGGRAFDYSQALDRFIERFKDEPEEVLFDVYNNVIYDPQDPINHAVNKQYAVYGHDLSIPFGDNYKFMKVYPIYGDVADTIFTRSDLSDPRSILVGPKIGYIMLAMATADLCEFGYYEPTPEYFFCGIPCWTYVGKRRYRSIQPVPVRFKTLGEPGFKCRPLTIGHWAVVTVLQSMRQMVEPLFHTDPSLRVGFESQNVLWDLLKYVQKHKCLKSDTYFMNSDFKSATDYMPLELIKAMWVGFLEGQELPENHPFLVFADLIWQPREIFPSKSCPWMDKSVIQTRGSFQGEPISFLSLTLANACGVEIVSQGTFGCLSDSLRFGKHRLNWRAPVAESIDRFASWQRYHILFGVVGDDNMTIANRKFRRNFVALMELAGMKFSTGKDLGSRFLLILCEDHAYYEKAEGILYFLDVVKHRLLSRMTRVHSDNRSAVIGKASMLTTQLSWETNRLLAACARQAYMWSFRQEMEEKMFLPGLPHELPNHLGGINLPRLSWQGFKEQYRLELRILQWILDLPIGEFLFYYIQLSQITERVQKGVRKFIRPDKFRLIFGSFIPGDLHDYQVRKPYRFYDRKQVIELLALREINIPRSPYSGQPINSEVLRLARTELRLIPISRYLESQRRTAVFSELFEEPGKVTDKVTFADYQRKTHKLWKKLRSLMTSGIFNAKNPLPEFTFRDFNDIGNRFRWRISSFIDESMLDQEGTSEEPTLQIEFNYQHYKDQKAVCRNCGHIHGFGFGGPLDDLMGSPCFVGTTGEQVSDLISLF